MVYEHLKGPLRVNDDRKLKSENVNNDEENEVIKSHKQEMIKRTLILVHIFTVLKSNQFAYDIETHQAHQNKSHANLFTVIGDHK